MVSFSRDKVIWFWNSLASLANKSILCNWFYKNNLGICIQNLIAKILLTCPIHSRYFALWSFALYCHFYATCVVYVCMFIKLANIRRWNENVIKPIWFPPDYFGIRAHRSTTTLTVGCEFLNNASWDILTPHDLLVCFRDHGYPQICDRLVYDSNNTETLLKLVYKQVQHSHLWRHSATLFYQQVRL